MRTCSSPTHSEDGNAIVRLETGSKRCDWSQQDETELINFLIEHKGELGEISSFKQSTWNAVAQHLDKVRVKGDPKTAKSCSVKWARVCSRCSGSFICSYVFIAQRSIHDCFHTQELFWFTLVWYQWPWYISQDQRYLWDICHSMFAVCFSYHTIPVYWLWDQTNPKVSAFKRTRFTHYDLMSDLMPTRVKGIHVFCASQQTHGAASNRPVSSGKGRGRGRGKDRGKGKDSERDQVMETTFECSDNLTSNNPNTGTTLLPPSPVPTSIIGLSTSASISAASSSKCKYSALDDLASTPSVSSKKCTMAAAIKDVIDGMAIISDLISNLTAEWKCFREHQEIQESLANAQDIQASQQASASLPMHRQAALRHLQELDSDLDPICMVNLADHIAKSTVVADTYMSWEWEDYHKAWITKMLNDIGCKEVVAVDK